MGFYAGDFLPGFHVESAPAFEEWIASQRAAARIFALETTESLAREAAGAERARDAVRWARRAVEIAPDEERVVRLLMELLAASGDRTAALDAYRSLKSRLAAEYGDTPSARTDALACAPPGPSRVRPTARWRIPPPSRPAPEPRYGWWRTSSVLLVVLLAVAGWLWRAPGERPREEISVAVLPFEVSAGGPYGYLEAGLPVLLSTRLHEAGPLRAVDPSTVLKAWDRRPTGERGDLEIGLGRRLNAALVVRGSVSGFGDSLRVFAHLWDVERGRRVASIETTGTEREVPGRSGPRSDTAPRGLPAGARRRVGRGSRPYHHLARRSESLAGRGGSPSPRQVWPRGPGFPGRHAGGQRLRAGALSARGRSGLGGRGPAGQHRGRAGGGPQG